MTGGLFAFPQHVLVMRAITRSRVGETSLPGPS